MPITDQGYEAMRASDWLVDLRADIETFVRDEYDQEVDWDADVLLSSLAAIVANRLGSLSELTKAIYDATDPNNAAGAQLDALASMVRVYRIQATKSVANLTLSGTTGTIVPAGKQAYGVGQLWTLLEDVTIPGKGQAECAVAGEIEADIGEIATIASPVIGWSGVTNLKAALPGREDETDGDLRLRRETRLAASAGRSLNAVRTALLALDFVEAALVLDNPDSDPQTVRGVDMPGCSVLAVVYPNPGTDERKEALALALYNAMPFSIEMIGDEAASVIGPDLNPKDVRWSVATEVTIDIEYTVALYPGVAIEDVEAELVAATEAFLSTLKPGDPLTTIPLFGLVAASGDVLSAVITVDGGPSYTPDADEVIRATVTVVSA